MLGSLGTAWITETPGGWIGYSKQVTAQTLLVREGDNKTDRQTDNVELVSLLLSSFLFVLSELSPPAVIAGLSVIFRSTVTRQVMFCTAGENGPML